LNIPDLLILTDNSNTPVKFIEMEKGNIVFRKENTPQWIQNVLKKEIEKDNSNKSLEEIKQQYKEQSNK
jgi:hypothetical protein